METTLCQALGGGEDEGGVEHIEKRQSPGLKVSPGYLGVGGVKGLAGHNRESRNESIRGWLGFRGVVGARLSVDSKGLWGL